MAYAIRTFRPDDASALAAITLAAIRGVGSRAYSAVQIDAWAARHPGPERFVSRAAAGAFITVAVDEDDTTVAYALLDIEPDEGGHLDMLYCHPDHTRRGLAERLLENTEQRAVTMGLDRLFTEASELARPAFERAGYTVMHRRDFDITHKGKAVPIHNFAMEKRLT